MRKNINSTHIEGYIYQHSLEVKQVQNQTSPNYGKDFITGELEVAVDENCLTIIPVHFTYVTATTSKGTENKTYTTLKQIIDTGKTVVGNGVQEATKVKIDSSLGLNDFITKEGEFVAAKRNEGGFVNIVTDLCKEDLRNTFTLDMVLTSFNVVEANPEKNTPVYGVLHGAAFNFRNDLLPIDLVIKNENGIAFFEQMAPSNSEPVYTKVWGRINFSTDRVEVAEESAFGESSVTTRDRKIREWLVTGTAKAPYEFGDEKVMTAEELMTAMQNRQVYLAEVKKRNDEYLASKAAGTASVAAPTAAAVKKGDFRF